MTEYQRFASNFIAASIERGWDLAKMKKVAAELPAAVEKLATGGREFTAGDAAGWGGGIGGLVLAPTVGLATGTAAAARAPQGYGVQAGLRGAAKGALTTGGAGLGALIGSLLARNHPGLGAAGGATLGGLGGYGAARLLTGKAPGEEAARRKGRDEDEELKKRADFTGVLSSGGDAAKSLGKLGLWGLGAAAVVPPLLGGLAGHGLAKATDIDDKDAVAELQSEELQRAYNDEARRLKVLKRARRVARTPRAPSLYGT